MTQGGGGTNLLFNCESRTICASALPRSVLNTCRRIANTANICFLLLHILTAAQVNLSTLETTNAGAAA